MNEQCVLIVFAMIWLCAVSAPAQLLFDDGRTHIVSTITDDLVTVTNQSRLIAENVTTAARFVVDNASFAFQGGRVGHIHLTNGNVSVNGLVRDEPGDDGRLNGVVNAHGASIVEIGPEGHVSSGFVFAVAVQETSSLFLNGGKVIGLNGVVGSGTASIEAKTGTIQADQGFHDFGCGVALELRDDSTARITDSELSSCSEVLSIGDRSNLEIVGGTVSAGSWSGLGLRATGSSMVRMRDVAMNAISVPAAQLMRLSQQSEVHVESAQFRYWSNQSRSAFSVEDAAHLTVDDGTFSSTSSDVSIFDARDQARIDINGGVYQTEDPVPIVTSSEFAAVDVRGGNFTINTRELPVILRHLQARHQSAIRIHGDNFNFPMGDVADVEGTIIGSLMDGSPIEWNFIRDDSARIVLVPEPTNIALVSMLGPLVFHLRRQHGVPR